MCSERKNERNAFIKMTISCYLESKDLSCQWVSQSALSTLVHTTKNYFFQDTVVVVEYSQGKKEGEPRALISFWLATSTYNFDEMIKKIFTTYFQLSTYICKYLQQKILILTKRVTCVLQNCIHPPVIQVIFTFVFLF